jgi:hypothetical protein
VSEQQPPVLERGCWVVEVAGVGSEPWCGGGDGVGDGWKRLRMANRLSRILVPFSCGNGGGGCERVEDDEPLEVGDCRLFGFGGVGQLGRVAGREGEQGVELTLYRTNGTILVWHRDWSPTQS